MKAEGNNLGNTDKVCRDDCKTILDEGNFLPSQRFGLSEPKEVSI